MKETLWETYGSWLRVIECGLCDAKSSDDQFRTFYDTSEFMTEPAICESCLKSERWAQEKEPRSLSLFNDSSNEVS